MAVSERRFGLEIECGVNGDVDAALERIYNDTGMRIERDYDGTEFELRTEPMRGEEGFKQLETIYRHLKNEGGYVTRSDGAHVHFEAEDYRGNHKLLATLVRSWVNLEPVTNRIIAPYRTGNYGSCPKINKATARQIRRGDDDWGRGALNINNVRIVAAGEGSVDRYGYCRGCGDTPEYCWCNERPPTIEVRCHEGSLDYDIMRPWIEMCQRLMDVVAENGLTVKTCARMDTLGRRLGLPDTTVNSLAAKSRMVSDPDSYYMSQFSRENGYY